jgi:hypothetical protein
MKEGEGDKWYAAAQISSFIKPRAQSNCLPAWVYDTDLRIRSLWSLTCCKVAWFSFFAPCLLEFSLTPTHNSAAHIASAKFRLEFVTSDRQDCIGSDHIILTRFRCRSPDSPDCCNNDRRGVRRLRQYADSVDLYSSAHRSCPKPTCRIGSSTRIEHC